jgi:Nif-specific regulatory protein
MAVRLIISVGEGIPASCDLVPHRSVTLGRHRSNTMVLQDKHASRQHAEVFTSNGRWFIRDCNTLNGTRINGKRITEPQPLADGEEIGIGDTRLLFLLDGSDRQPVPPPQEKNGRLQPDAPARGTDKPEPPAKGSHKPDAPARGPQQKDKEPSSGEQPQTILQVDELTALCSFMASAVEETSPRALIERALAIIHTQTGAGLTGFLSLDPEDPLPRVVLPEKADVDAHLSRRLTRRVQEEGVICLSQTSEAMDSSSLLSFQDALCVLVGGKDAPLGALHVYKTGKPFSERDVRFCEVLAGNLANSLRMLRTRRTLEAENSRLRGHSPAGNTLIGDSVVMYRLRQDVARLAPRACTVLITGESGVGKELVANDLHRQSARCEGPFVAVNCAAIAASLADAELFGHCEGGFTGATCDRPGYFEQANDGTLFLDEIGELSMECQAKLLRVIEGKGFRPVRGVVDVHVDLRIVAATHRNLQQMVQEGKFRQDLVFRLGVPIKVPALREHAEDIPALVEHFLTALRQEYRRPLQLTQAALRRLQAYSWPGNVRQLRAVLENAVAMTDSETLDVENLHLPDSFLGTSPNEPPTLNLEQLEAWALRRALAQTGWHIAQTAELLGVNRDTVTNKIKKHNLRREDV